MGVWGRGIGSFGWPGCYHHLSCPFDPVDIQTSSINRRQRSDVDAGDQGDDLISRQAVKQSSHDVYLGLDAIRLCISHGFMGCSPTYVFWKRVNRKLEVGPPLGWSTRTVGQKTQCLLEVVH